MDLKRAKWRKAKASGSNGGGCVEVAMEGREVAVRDSKRPEGGAFVTDKSQWRKFVATVKAGRYDLP